jgi:hypothetical protein
VQPGADLGLQVEEDRLGVVAMLGTVALIACEFFATTAAHALVGSPDANAVDNAYGIPMVLIGIGLVLAGIKPVLSSGRWMPLVLGVYVFVPLFPAVFGPMVLGRLAIGVWMLLFAVLGVALIRSGR